MKFDEKTGYITVTIGDRNLKFRLEDGPNGPHLAWEGYPYPGIAGSHRATWVERILFEALRNLCGTGNTYVTEGAGRPMTWTRGAGPIETAARDYVSAERNHIRATEMPEYSHLLETTGETLDAAWTNLCVAVDGWAPETSASESARPQAEPSTRSKLTPSDSQLAPASGDTAPIREAKADPAQGTGEG